MKTLIVLLILGVGGWYGWQWYQSDDTTAEANQESSAGEQPADYTVPEPETMAAAMAVEDAERDGRGPAVNPPANGETAEGGGAGPGVLPEAMQELYDATQARWEKLAATGGNPATDNEAVRLGRDYTKVLRATYGKESLREFREQLLSERLEPIADALFFSPAPYLQDPTGFVVNYTVKSGDILNDIGREYGMSYQFINMLRNREPEDGNLGVGDRLKLFNLKERGYQIHVFKNDFQMDLHIGDIFARRYDIGIGEEVTPTPKGATHITAREKYPQWTDPKTNTVYEYGEDGHILGPVWLAFDPKIGRSGLGIHGYTGDGQATGVRASNGCIRMRNEQALEVYNILVPCGVYRGKFVSRAPMSVTIIE